MSSLWTPDGEHRVTREGEAPAEQSPGQPSPADPGSDASTEPIYDGVSEEEMRMVARELLAAPVEAVVANHCYGMFELAALHLAQQPPNLEAARTAIDAMGLVVEGLGARLGEHATTLEDGLTQVRLAWVKIAETGPAPDPRAEPAGGPA